MPAYPRNARWHYRSLESGHQFHQRLWLYPEADGAAMVDELPDDATPHDQLEAYVRYCRSHYADAWKVDAIPVMWSVQASHTSEFAPYQSYGKDWLTYLSWPVDDNGDQLDWFRLPIVVDRFPDLTKALNYPFAPFQRTLPLRSLWASRERLPLL